MTLRSKVAVYDTRRIFISQHLPDDEAATAANYGVIFICPADDRYIFVGAEVVWTVAAGADAGLQLEKLIDGEAPDAAGGDDLLSAELDLELAAETVRFCAPVADVAARTLAAGDRICMVDRGDVSAVRNLQITIELEELTTVRAKSAETEAERIFATAILYDTQPQTAAMHDKFFTASKRCEVVAARYVHTTASGNADGYIQVERLQGTTEVPGDGDDLLTDNAGEGFSTNGVAETVLTGTIVADGTQILEVGDRLALDPVDAELGAVLVGVCVTVELQALD